MTDRENANARTRPRTRVAGKFERCWLNADGCWLVNSLIRQSTNSPVHHFSACRPLPRVVEHIGSCNHGLAKPFFQRDRAALGQLLQRIDQRRGVRDDHDLRSFCGLRNQSAERRQQIRMQAGFRFVQDQQTRRPRRQQRGDPAADSAACRRTVPPLSRDGAGRAAASRTSNQPSLAASLRRVRRERRRRPRDRPPPYRRFRGSSGAPRRGPARRDSTPACACRSAARARARSRRCGNDRRSATPASPRAASAPPACSADRRSGSSCCRSWRAVRDDRPVAVSPRALHERPRRSTRIAEGRSVSPLQTHSRLISGSWPKARCRRAAAGRDRSRSRNRRRRIRVAG